MTRGATGELRVAVIGCGYWGVNYVRVLDQLPMVSEVLAVDERPVRLKEIGETYPRASLVPSLDALLESDRCDAAVIATPAESHLEVTRRLIQAGKHVLVEKPITTRSHDAEELIELAEASSVTLLVGQTFIYHPAVQKVQSYIESGKAGRIYYLYSRRTNLGPIRRDVNALWDLAPHDISIFNYLLGGQPVWVSAVGHNPLRSRNADVGFVTLGYPNDVVAHLHVSWADPSKVRELVVVGSRRRIVFDDTNATERVKVYKKGVTHFDVDSDGYAHEGELLFRDGAIVSPHLEPSEPLKNQTIDFLECALSGREPRSTGRVGLEVVRVMEAIDRSMMQNGVPVLVHDGVGVAVEEDTTVVDLSAYERAGAVAREVVR